LAEKVQSGNDYAQSQPRVNQEGLKKAFCWKPQPFQPKPVSVETVDPNRTRPYCIVTVLTVLFSVDFHLAL